MDTVTFPTPFTAPSSWRDLILPKEHGSWSLAFEPLVFGLLFAPSTAGLAFALAAAAAFFGRRPLKIAVRDQRPARRAEARTAVLACVGSAAALFLITLVLAGTAWVGWLLPAAALGGLFISLDLRNAAREEVAEVAGSAAFAVLPGVLVILAGGSPTRAVVAALIMLGRAVPTVFCVRALLRGAKTGEWRIALPLVLALAAFAAGVYLFRDGDVSIGVPVLFAALLLRAMVLLFGVRGAWRARTIGMIEAANGIGFVLLAGLA